MVKLDNPAWVQLYSEIAEEIMCNGASGMSDYLTEVREPDGSYTECFTEEGQEIFNYYCDIACSILNRNGVYAEAFEFEGVTITDRNKSPCGRFDLTPQQSKDLYGE